MLRKGSEVGVQMKARLMATLGAMRPRTPRRPKLKVVGRYAKVVGA